MSLLDLCYNGGAIPGGPRRASAGSSARYLGRFKRVANVWFNLDGSEKVFEPTEGWVFGCYEVDGGWYDVYAELKLTVPQASEN